MTGAAPRIVLIHAVTVAMAPVAEAFAERWPGADTVNLLDDSLTRELGTGGDLTTGIFARFAALTRYAVDIGADGILFTCSAFGEAIDAARAGVGFPVLKPNEAMFEAALDAGERIGMLSTAEAAVASMEAEFRVLARERGAAARLETVCVTEAMAALVAGDAEAHNRMLADAAPRLAGCDAVLLAHFSTARALGAVSAATHCPVLSAPASAVDKLRNLVG